jgi:hypothetical protein
MHHSYYITFNQSKKLITNSSIKNDNTFKVFEELFKVNLQDIIVQMYHPHINDFVDVDTPRDLLNMPNLKLKVVNARANVLQSTPIQNLGQEVNQINSFFINNSSISIEETAETSTSSSTPTNWIKSFAVPWDTILSKNEISDLSQGKRLLPSRYNEINRSLVNHILTACQSPAKKHLERVAEMMVDRFPVYLDKDLNGCTIGSGYESVLTKIINRVGNLKCTRKEKNNSLVEDENEKVTDEYGCCRYYPKTMSIEETNEMKQKQEEMKTMSLSSVSVDVLSLITQTYDLQRMCILNKKANTIRELHDDWPLLFTCSGIKVHFEILTDIKLDSQLSHVFENINTVINYMRFTGGIHYYKLGKRLDELSNNNGNAKLQCAIMVIMYYFKETNNIFYLTPNIHDLQQINADETIPLTPCLICEGTDILSSTQFRLSLDKKIMEFVLMSFKDALICFFASYFNFNYKYPKQNAVTMEFLEGFIFGLTAEIQSKNTQNKKKGRKHHPQVLQLNKALSDFRDDVDV